MSFFKKQQNRAFTIVELIVSVGIFALLTTLLIGKYGTFNQSVLLTNLAYDVALTIRNAQTYGLNVKSKPTAGGAAYTSGTYDEIKAGFQYGYGVHFVASADGSDPNSKKMIFYADNETQPSFENGTVIATYTLRNGAYISSVCAQQTEGGANCISSSSPNGGIDVAFRRPDPDAIFPDTANATIVTITVKTTSGQTKNIIVRKTGQIAVLQNQ